MSSGALLTLVSSIFPQRSALSLFELERRKSKGSESAAYELRREVMLEDVLSLRHAAEALLLVVMVATSIGAFGAFLGIVIAAVASLLYGRIGRIEAVHKWSQAVYVKIEVPILRYIERYPQAARALRAVVFITKDRHISSREELEHIVEQSGTILTADERKMILNGLEFDEKTVEHIMTPRGVIESISKNELLGPLMLDQLHKTGHSRFPVIDGDIDHVVGILHVKELLTSFDKKTQNAQKAMEPRVFYINQDQTLQHALAAFIKTRHHLFIVVNGYRETAGILTLEDVIEALLGRKIVDEFDVHDDLRVVAARNAKTNNNSPHGTNV